MIAELSAAMAALKETAGLVKVISAAKTDAEIKAATFELQSKLITLQADCFNLGDAVRSRDEEVVLLKAKIAEFEDFKTETEGYVLNKLASGTLVYSKKQFVGDSEITVNLCPNCYARRNISMLQPLEPSMYAKFSQCRCPSCTNVFDADLAPPVRY